MLSANINLVTVASKMQLVCPKVSKNVDRSADLICWENISTRRSELNCSQGPITQSQSQLLYMLVLVCLDFLNHMMDRGFYFTLSTSQVFMVFTSKQWPLHIYIRLEEKPLLIEAFLTIYTYHTIP